MLQQTEEKRLLKVHEVAGRLRLSRSAIYKLISSGSLPIVNLAQKDRMVPRVREVDLDEFIRDRKEKRSQAARGNQSDHTSEEFKGSTVGCIYRQPSSSFGDKQ